MRQKWGLAGSIAAFAVWFGVFRNSFKALK